MSASSVSIEEKAWLAGILDGEGCFACYAGGPSGNAICCNVTVFSSDWRIIARLKDLFNRITGFHIPAYPDRKGGWTLNVTRKPAICALIPVVARHLVMKRPQAALLYAIACRSWQSSGGNAHIGTPKWAHVFKDRIQWYNQHHYQPDGTMRLTNLARTRQSRRKPALQEPRETACGAANIAEGTVHSA
jgi:hypothetical protein